MNESLDELNKALAGFTDVLRMEVSFHLSQAIYEVEIVLADDVHKVITLRCKDVSGLQISEFGGGMAQFVLLRAMDLRESRLDRAKFHFSDLEHQRIQFDCLTAELVP
jgi:hypothetical protein